MLGMLVSIVMPVYNVEQYVERAIKSVYNQTYKALELIIVDDCGTDDSMKIVERLIKENDINNICRVFHHAKNRGLSAARNTGVENSKGQYVYFFDSDDELTPDCIEQLMQIVFRHPTAEVVTGNMSILSEDGSMIEKYRFFKDTKSEDRFEFSEDRVQITNLLFNYSSNKYIPAVSVNKIYRKSWLVENNLEFVEGLIHEDEKFIFDISNCIHNIGIFYDSTYLRYINPNSIMTSLTKEKSAKAWLYIIEKSYPSLKEPLLKLKIRYCIVNIKDILFSLSTSNASLLSDFIRLLRKISVFALKNFFVKEYFYAWLLICLPNRLRYNGLIVRIYHRIFRYDKFLSI